MSLLRQWLWQGAAAPPPPPPPPPPPVTVPVYVEVITAVGGAPEPAELGESSSAGQGQTAASICSEAFVELGADPVVDFDDATTEAKIASQLYASTVRRVIARHPWRFATKGASVNKIITQQETPYDSAYLLPSDCVRVWSVRMPGGGTLPADSWEVYGNEVHLNGGGDVVEVDYSRVVSESRFPAHFVEALTAFLMHRFAGALTQTSADREQLRRDAEGTLSIARAIDTSLDAPNRLRPRRFLAVRR